MKKIVCVLMAVALLISALPAAAEEQTVVYVNGEQVVFADQAPVIVSGRMLVPMRAVFEQFGCYVAWDGLERSVFAIQGRLDSVRMLALVVEDTEMLASDLSRDSNGYLKDLRQTISLDVPAVILNDRVMVPLRAISDALGATVNWVASENAAYIDYDREKIVPVHTDQEARTYIDQHYVKAQHILVKDEAVAQTLIARIQAGEDFDGLMYEYNTDPGMTDHPQGYVFTKGEMVEPFEKEAFGLAVGQVSAKPVKSDYGYHILRRVALEESDYTELTPHVILTMLFQTVGLIG